MTLAMAPTSPVYLPDSVSIVPAPSTANIGGEQVASGEEASQTEASSPASAVSDQPQTSGKEGRLVAPVEPAALAATEDAEKVAALEVVEPTKTSLAQSALSLVSLDKPTSPKGGIDGLIEKYAELYDVPVVLVRRVVKRESNFRPTATNRGHYGLMQIKPATARSMGYKGSARGLLDAETNLKYAVKYLRGAYLVADGNHDRADRLYQTGYYYHAKRKGLLEETGLGKDRRRRKG